MESQMKIEELCCEIKKQLTPLIDNDYVLWDLPYYTNIGDTLIWAGTESFLNNIPTQCLSKYSYQTFKYKKLPEDTIILLQGGGNFGDLWRMHQDFRLKIIELYPNNKIIILPQSIYYQDKDVLVKDAELMGRHSNLTICVRDRKSLEILTSYFYKNNLLLVPDMAFYIDQNFLLQNSVNCIDRILYLKRTDIELFKSDDDVYITEDKSKVEVRDWPTIETIPFQFRIFDVLTRLYLNKIANYLFINYLKRYLLKKGVKFLSQYKKIYTTRLHVAILSILLNKTCVFFDNSYGKNKALYETWLEDLDNLYFH